MKVSKVLEYAVLLLLFAAVGAMLFGQAAGQPVLLGYVETGSMAPTMNPGDGFVAVPMAVAGPIESGDVVTFQAEELHGGGLTTHRIVRETEEGYITRGDANPFTDQAGAEPPVDREQIVAQALEFNGQVIVLRNLGVAVVTVQEFATGAMAATGIGALLGGGGSAQSLVWVGVAIIAVGFVVDAVTSDRSTGGRNRRRGNYIKTSTFLVVLVLIVTAPATASMVLPSGTTSFDIVSSESPNEDPLVLPVGGQNSVEYTVTNDGYIPVLTVIEPKSEGVSVSRSAFIVEMRSEQTTQLLISAPEETGAYTRSISQWRYLPILPRSLLLSLHAVHPLAAVAAIDLVLTLGTVASGLIAVGIGPIRMRSEKRNVTFVQQLKRRFL
ncbi:signal peptidase I [Halobellus sp. EA9]|uniref:signal peptidase I n=1 Tax=Halobellus sp. EA9 TaxID=3421647 RepID=UPI003EC0872F